MDQQELTKLRNPDKIKEFSEAIKEIVATDEVGGAKKILAALTLVFSRQPDFQKADPYLFAVYYNYLVAVQYVDLFDLDEAVIVDLIKKEFDFVLAHPEYDLIRKIRYKIRSINSLEGRDAFKEKIRQALLDCQATLGQGNIIMNGVSAKPTVANWLKDYYAKVGIDRVDALKLNEYLTSNKNLKNLTEAEKDSFKKLLNFFEHMKVSSQELPAFEESIVAILPDGKVSLILEGQFAEEDLELVKLIKELNLTTSGQAEVPAKTAINDVLEEPSQAAEVVRPADKSPWSVLEQSLTKYPPTSLEYKAIKQELGRMEKLASRPKSPGASLAPKSKIDLDNLKK